MLGAYARMGLWSFNLTLMPDALAETSGRHRLTARLLPRFYLHPHLHNSDTAYLQLLLGENRITSYNVCYTKLLRSGAATPRRS